MKPEYPYYQNQTMTEKEKKIIDLFTYILSYSFIYTD